VIALRVQASVTGKKRVFILHLSTGGILVPKNRGEQENQASKNQGKQDSGAWAHWEYTPDEWAQLDLLDWRSVAQRHWLAVGITAPGSLLALALFLWSTLTDGGAIGGFAFFLMNLLFILFLLHAQLFWDRYDKAKKRHQTRQKSSQPYRVTFSSQGIWEAGTHFPVGGFDVKLLDVHLTSQPTTLHFRIQYLSSYRTDRGTRSQRTRETIHLLVPRDHESEAEHIAQRFRIEVIEVRERAEKRAKDALDALANPPEPS